MWKNVGAVRKKPEQLYTINNFLLIPNFRVYMVSEEEWSVLKDTFSIDQEISVTINRKTDISGILLCSEPPVCDECLAKRCREEEEEQLI